MFDLTPKEKKVLIVLGAFAVLGLAVLGYRNYFAGPRLEIKHSEIKSGADYEDVIKQKSVVNINNADAARIEILPGIGPNLAKEIVAYRNNHGPFLSKEDLKKVKGIGPKKFDELKEYISLE